jgi:hypothetical protein
MCLWVPSTLAQLCKSAEEAKPPPWKSCPHPLQEEWGGASEVAELRQRQAD